jgi:hypothetical protein
MRVVVKRMWEGGPLRQWSADSKRPGSAFIRQDSGGYAGSYVCEACRCACDGVYCTVQVQKWLCGRCKAKISQPPSKQPDQEEAAA